MLIYLVTNLANGKKYVGQTRLRLEHRWKQHVRDAGNGSSTLIGAAIRKYGTDAFSVSIICTRSSQAELDTAERFYISSLGTHSSTGNGYNLTAGGYGGQHCAVGPMTGKRHSPATREKMRKSHEGKSHPYARDQRGVKNPMFGKKPRITLLMIQKAKELGLANKGRSPSQKNRDAVSAALLGKPKSKHMREALRLYHASRHYYGA